MEIEDQISDVNVRIEKVKAKLKPLLEEKKRLLTKRAADLGCTCGAIIMDYDVHRLDNRWCKVHHPSG